MKIMNKIINVKMWYDEYEKYFGDGFYPFFKEKENKIDLTEIIINFEYKQKIWRQIDKDEITRLDGDTGKLLLEYLNSEGNEKGIIIKNNYNIIIYQIGR